jgi:hypothetical protein
MLRRLFPKDPPWIAFRKKSEPLVHGDLVPGRKVKILYDSARLPEERSVENGAKAWTIKAFYKFVEQGSVYQVDLWTESGAIQSKMSNDTAEGTIMVCSIQIPPDVDHVSLWFLNAGKSGAEYWDSNFGKNYIFRFVVADLDVESVKVVQVPGTHQSQFEVDLTAAPDVSQVGVSYWITNASPPAAAPSYLALSPTGPPDTSGHLKWSGAVAVPQNAVVKFSFVYSAWGNQHEDTNGGHRYLSWPGAVYDRAAGVL